MINLSVFSDLNLMRGGLGGKQGDCACFLINPCTLEIVERTCTIFAAITTPNGKILFKKEKDRKKPGARGRWEELGPSHPMWGSGVLLIPLQALGLLGRALAGSTGCHGGPGTNSGQLSEGPPSSPLLQAGVP